MAVAHEGAISFGLVHNPVNLYTATQDNDISFNQHHKDDNLGALHRRDKDISINYMFVFML